MIAEAEAFAVIERLLGFRAEPTRALDVMDSVAERLRARGCPDAPAYRRLLDDAHVRATETRALADRLTVNETYFLRESAQLDVIVETLVPRLLARGVSPVRVLSVGCATGEEPYGLALGLHRTGIAREAVEILGLDVSPNVVANARRGHYSEWALRNVPGDLCARYFERERKGYRLIDEIRERVRFDVANVVSDDGHAWQSSGFHIAICRNLLIYLTPRAIERAVGRLAGVLAPGGALFLGHAETQLAGARFSVQEERGAFYFRLRAEPSAPAWSEPIERASSQVLEMAARLPPSAGRPTKPSSLPAPRHEALEEVLELMQQERFEEALVRVEASASDSLSERAMLRAVILTNLGRTADAKQAVSARLARLPSCARSHYLLGVCRETLLEFEEARASYARAVELDPAFAMAGLRAGMLARRAGQLDAARRALTTALEHFPRQAARTLLLFGGGFTHDVLAALCRTELAALGAAAGGSA